MCRHNALKKISDAPLEISRKSLVDLSVQLVALESNKDPHSSTSMRIKLLRGDPQGSLEPPEALSVRLVELKGALRRSRDRDLVHEEDL